MLEPYAGCLDALVSCWKVLSSVLCVAAWRLNSARPVLQDGGADHWVGLDGLLPGLARVPDREELAAPQRGGAQPGHVWVRHRRQCHLRQQHPAAHLHLERAARLQPLDPRQPGHRLPGRPHLLSGVTKM